MEHDFKADFILFPDNNQDPDLDTDNMEPTYPYLHRSQPDYNNNNNNNAQPATGRRSRSPSRDRNNSNYRDQRSPANGYDRGDRRPSRSEQPQNNMEDRQNSQQDRRVYVGNLAYDVKWHHLKDHMREGTSKLLTSSLPHCLLTHKPCTNHLTAGQVLFADVLELPNGMSKVSKIQAGYLALPIHICTH